VDGAKERRWWPAKGGGGGLEVVAEKFSQGEKEMRGWRLGFAIFSLIQMVLLI